MNRQKASKNGLKAALIFFLLILFVSAAALFLTGRLSLEGGRLSYVPSAPSGPVGTGSGYAVSSAPGDLEALAREDSRVEEVINRLDIYPEEMITLLLKNPDARDYVLNYPNHMNETQAGAITQEELSGGVPLFLQWDSRWGYINYGSGMLGITGCGPTCLSMVAVSLTGYGNCSPAAVAEYSEANGHYVYGSGTAWSLMTEGAAAFGLSAAEIPLWEDGMVSELQSGRPIIANVGPGDFTDFGHFVVITGYENGMFIINDPNSPTKSGQGWTYETLEGQITNMWSYSKA